ncbi:Atr8, partial [Stachybotrys chartarum IBT 40288]
MAVEKVQALENVSTPAEKEPGSKDLGFDPAELQKKYEAERNLRIKNGGVSQYRSAWKSGFGYYLEDPNADANFSRDPIDARYDAVIMGGGFSGLLVAARLVQQGITNFAILDKSADFGGTWYWSRYPGAQCDVDSTIYLPLLEEVGYIPKEKYSFGPEILEHAQRIAKHFDLYPKALFQTEVKTCHWSEEDSLWTVQTDRGDNLRAQFIVSAFGISHMPKLPGISGIENFQGKSFHASRWDYNYTGGDSTGNMTRLADKRVGIIGTGATAIQVVPKLAESAKELYVFQRTPSSVDVRNNRPTNAEWAKTLRPGWQQERIDNFYAITTGENVTEDLIDDGWTEIFRLVAAPFFASADVEQSLENRMEQVQIADFKKMESVRARVDSLVKDPATAASLKPWYNQFCKRPCFHDEYLQAFNHPNVTLVDTRGHGVDGVTTKGVLAQGKEYELDCLIYSTGYEWYTEWEQRTRSQVYGRNGLTITKKWSQGITTYHGWGVHGFPNFMVLSSAQVNNVPNYTHMVGYLSRHLAYIIRTCKDRGIKSVEPTANAESKWVQQVVEQGAARRDQMKLCTPGYLNHEGDITEKTDRLYSYNGSGDTKFQIILDKWREEGKLVGLSIDGATEAD